MAPQYFFLVTLVAFFAIFSLLNYYALIRLKRVFGWKDDVILRKVAGGVLVVFVILIAFLSYFADVRALMIVVPVWIVALAYYSLGFAVADIVSRYLGVDYARVGRIMIGLVSLLVVWGVYNSYAFDVNEIEIPIEGLSEPLEVVHLSDVHIGEIRGRGYLSGLVSQVNALEPDFVIITGDFFDGSDNVDENTVAPLKELTMPVYFSMGNHEGYFGRDRAQDLLSGAGVHVLRNEVMVYDGVQIVGTDFTGGMFSDDNPLLAGIELDDSRPSLLLFHSPVGIEDAKSAGIDAQFSGHTHGGQIFPFSLVTNQFYPVFRGLYEFDGLFVYVSQGTGTFGPPMRIGTDNEIALVRLVPA